MLLGAVVWLLSCVLTLPGEVAKQTEIEGSEFDLSVVLCGRNDGHAGDFLARLRWSLLSIALGLCRRQHLVSAEIVLVEWRPPPENERLLRLVFKWFKEVLAEGGFDCGSWQLPSLRIITVSDSDARTMQESLAAKRPLVQWGGLNMLQWHCKNVGVRRARGAFLLVTNADDFFSPQLLDVLASVRRLRTDSFYRAQTVSVKLRDPWIPFESFVLDSIFQGQLYAVAEEHVGKWAEHDGVLASGISRQLCENSSMLHASHESELQAFWSGYDAAFGVKLNETALEYHSRPYPWNLYMDLPGDFLLASRDAWAEVRGAPLLLQNHNVDMLLICRFANRFRQVVLSTPCFVATYDHPSIIHDQFRELDRQVLEAQKDFELARSRMRVARARWQRGGQPPVTLLSNEVLRLNAALHRQSQRLKRLKDKHELRIDNTFDRCRDPFRPFASEFASSSGRLAVELQDWGFNWMPLEQKVIQF